LAECTAGPTTTKKCGQSETAQAFEKGGYKKAIPKDIRQELTSLQSKDNWHNISYLAFDWLIVAAAIAVAVASDMNPLVYMVVVLVIGSRQRALMNLVHEASHKKLFKKRLANDWVGKLLAAWPLLTSLSAYVCAHCRHHGYLWDESKDPKTASYEALGFISVPRGKGQFLLYLVKPFFLLHVVRNVWHSLSWEGEPRSETVGRIIFWTVLLALLFTAGLLTEFLLFWVLPFLTSFQICQWPRRSPH
jgi:fatty acid desaturase